ncbi:sugar O-acetyltransferase [Chryseobacterium sp. JV274]|jgi:maltose O-acetyltransferase|uniref:sugar O-acetyltransferase n=1 Tax=unclassified Chryseobacterium TaxID=2593645 RepID=UPI0009864CF2|nr:sugar O-acetyltransferase [Chryseobacterium sp. JV274]CAD0218963.1 Galactoside O-acetyltransferase [Chryseobacterium sp. JV274]
MTEKEKCAAGLLYNANYDKELIQERIACKDLCQEYNGLKNSEAENKYRILKSIISDIKENICIEPNFWCDYGYNIKVGENFYANHNLIILDCAKVEFGDNVFIGPNCSFYTAGHPVDAKQRNEGLEYAHPIKVGNNVWLGGNVVVLPGVSIGNNSVIGAGSVVTKDIPDHVVAVGNPCKVVKKITEQN